jgi:hypothetical protein
MDDDLIGPYLWKVLSDEPFQRCGYPRTRLHPAA